MNGQQIKYHPSYCFTGEEISQMTDKQQNWLQKERAEYQHCQGLPPKQSNWDQIQELRAEIASLRSIQGDQIVPQTINDDTSQAQISQVTTSTAGGSIIGGQSQQGPIIRYDV